MAQYIFNMVDDEDGEGTTFEQVLDDLRGKGLEVKVLTTLEEHGPRHPEVEVIGDSQQVAAAMDEIGVEDVELYRQGSRIEDAIRTRFEEHKRVHGVNANYGYLEGLQEALRIVQKHTP